MQNLPQLEETERTPHVRKLDVVQAGAVQARIVQVMQDLESTGHWFRMTFDDLPRREIFAQYGTEPQVGEKVMHSLLLCQKTLRELLARWHEVRISVAMNGFEPPAEERRFGKKASGRPEVHISLYTPEEHDAEHVTSQPQHFLLEPVLLRELSSEE